VRALADSPHLGTLEHLDLQTNPIGRYEPWTTEELAEGHFVQQLLDLRLTDCNLNDVAVASLLRGDFPALTELYLGMNTPGEAAFRALAGTTRFGQLRTLDLGRCGLTGEVARLLGQVDTLPVLRHLNLAHNPLGEEGARYLLAGPLVQTVTHLDLEDAQLTDDGAEALAASPAVANLLALDLAKNRISARGANALAASPHLARLKQLNLSGNRITKKGKDALIGRFDAEVCQF
jgi:Ran GTPase-activating protein (RanGAP) involved in mRNA processing and transport